MSKQDIIREGIKKLAREYFSKIAGFPSFYPGEFTDKLSFYLHSQGVVLKVDKNTADFIKCPCDDCTAEHKLIDEWGYFCDLTCGQRSHWISRCRGRQETLEVGYIAVEPLIEE